MPYDRGIFSRKAKDVIKSSVSALYELNRDGATLMMNGPYPDDRIERVRRALFSSIDERISDFSNVEGDPGDRNWAARMPKGAKRDRDTMRKMTALLFDYMSKESFLEDIVNLTLDKIEVPGGDHD